ncbi:MAG: transcriptional regulator [Prevotellaceae bacterium]|jgi:DNA-binding CsgD family transcriptional regulator|nr:transcriptional regulator [Prevotellaceae bacterium]
MKGSCRFSVCLAALVVSFVGSLYAAGGRNSFIINYPKHLAVKAGAQTWQISAYDSDWIYFANQNGILQYNGHSWMLFPLHNGVNARSVQPSADGRHIYVGGISEFGYLQPSADGVLHYVCMSDSIKGQERFIGNVWGIHELDDILYFQGDTRFLKYVHGTYSLLDVGCKIDCSEVVNGVLFAGTSEGVKVLMGNRFIPLNGADYLNHKRIREFIDTPRGALVVTASDGLFLCDGHNCVPYQIGVEPFLIQNEVFCAAVSGHYLALGTIRQGVVIIDTRTGDTSYFNEDNGLQNNTVLSLTFDDAGNVWAGTDNGIDYICFNSSWSNLYPSQDSYGTGYDALLDGNSLYLGTSRGLYHLHYPAEANSTNVPDLISNSSGQVWSLERFGDHLFCFHDRGVYLVEQQSLKRISTIGSAWTGQPLCDSGRYPDSYYIGVYDGLFLLTLRNGQWEARRIEYISDSFRFFQQESPRVLWMTDLDHCYRVELDSALTHVTSRTLFDATKGMPAGRIRIHKIGGKIFFSADDGFVKYDPESDSMMPADSLNKMLGTKSFCYDLTAHGDCLFGLTHDGISIVAPGDTVARMLLFNRQMTELVPDAETIIPLHDSLVIVPHYNGFAVAMTSKPDEAMRHAVHIFNVYTTYPRDSLLYTVNYLDRKPKPRIAYQRNSVRMEFGIFAFSDDEEVTYRYRLNHDEWSAPGTSTVKEYSNLREGQYLFEVQALFGDGSVSTDLFEFRILPPWYRSVYAYMAYVLLMLLFGWCIYKWDDLRVNRKKQQVALEKDKEIEKVAQDNALKEQQIIRLEKEKLERDLQYKSQEMANLMISFTRKNEILSEIKADLHQMSAAVKAGNEKEVRQQLLIVSNKIDSNTNSEEVLRRIEEQFDLIHNNFMTHLQEQHPDLSFNERMMCAYLKMNLSSKEIAPLLNISVRGVETMRYRIRKKINLEHEESLMDYLNRMS